MGRGGGGRGAAIAMIGTWHAEDEEEGRQGYDNHLSFQIMVKDKANKGALGLMLLVID